MAVGWQYPQRFGSLFVGFLVGDLKVHRHCSAELNQLLRDQLSGMSGFIQEESVWDDRSVYFEWVSSLSKFTFNYWHFRR